MNDKIKYLILGLIIGGISVLILLNLTKTVYPKGMMGQSVSLQNSDVVDAHFIEQMIPHHEDAITMSKLALDKATKPEVETLAKNIISSQSKEIELMKAWYKEWYGHELPEGYDTMESHGMMSGSSMHMGMMGSDSDLEELKNAEDFDKKFVEEMIPHHQMAVMMASMLKNSTNRPEMKKLADDIITAQTSEIDLMRGWLNEWE